MAEFAQPNPNIIIDEKKPNIIIDEKKPEVKKVPKENVCMIGITNSNPYDSSELPNDATTYYSNINYFQLEELYTILKNNSETDNMVYKTIQTYIKDRKTQVFFDFKCSSDCHSGQHFINDKTNLLVYKFINTMTRLGCNIVVGDHSMASLFNNWDRFRMDFKSPIQIKSETTDGPFKMTSSKEDLLNSCHPILKNLGDMSSENTVDIEFSNMSGTKIFSIKSENKIEVKIISKGKPCGFREIQEEQPVHCEFTYRNGKIIVSATHWCNLTNVNSKVDVEKVREQYTQKYGEYGRQQFEQEYREAMSSGCTKTVNRVVSDSVKFICSNNPTPSKSNYQQKIINKLKSPEVITQKQEPPKSPAELVEELPEKALKTKKKEKKYICPLGKMDPDYNGDLA